MNHVVHFLFDHYNFKITLNGNPGTTDVVWVILEGTHRSAHRATEARGAERQENDSR
jgi:hypothetical protein